MKNPLKRKKSESVLHIQHNNTSTGAGLLKDPVNGPVQTVAGTKTIPVPGGTTTVSSGTEVFHPTKGVTEYQTLGTGGKPPVYRVATSKQGAEALAHDAKLASSMASGAHKEAQHLAGITDPTHAQKAQLAGERKLAYGESVAAIRDNHGLAAWNEHHPQQQVPGVAAPINPNSAAQQNPNGAAPTGASGSTSSTWTTPPTNGLEAAYFHGMAQQAGGNKVGALNNEAAWQAVTEKAATEGNWQLTAQDEAKVQQIAANAQVYQNEQDFWNQQAANLAAGQPVSSTYPPSMQTTVHNVGAPQTPDGAAPQASGGVSPVPPESVNKILGSAQPGGSSSKSGKSSGGTTFTTPWE